MRPSLFAVAALFVSSIAARADTVYTFTGTNPSVTGELTFSSSLAANMPDQQALPQSYRFTNGTVTLTENNSFIADGELATDSNGDITQFLYAFSTATEGIGISSNGSVGTKGSFSPGVAISVTPEPSSLAMLGTGMLGIVGMARRRFARV